MWGMAKCTIKVLLCYLKQSTATRRAARAGQRHFAFVNEGGQPHIAVPESSRTPRPGSWRGTTSSGRVGRTVVSA
jgi:hypothetical protein